MSRGYWFLIAAAGLAALFIAAGTGAYFGSLYSPDHKQYQAVAGDQRGQSDYRGPTESLPNVSGIPGPFERLIANPPPSSGQDHEKRDLAAQEAMAVWAFWMFTAAFATFGVTSVGTILIWKQVSLTREAVEDTGRATKQMERQNDIAEDTAHRQLRAYISPGKASITISRKDGMAYLEFKTPLRNIGQTPAYLRKYKNFEKMGIVNGASQFTPNDDVIISPNSEFSPIGKAGVKFETSKKMEFDCTVAMLFTYADYMGTEYTEIIIWVGHDITLHAMEGVFDLHLLSQTPGPQGEWQWSDGVGAVARQSQKRRD